MSSGVRFQLIFDDGRLLLHLVVLVLVLVRQHCEPDHHKEHSCHEAARRTERDVGELLKEDCESSGASVALRDPVGRPGLGCCWFGLSLRLTATRRNRQYDDE